MFRTGINVDSLLKVVDLRSLKFIDTLKVQATAVAAQWPAAMNDIENAKQRAILIDSSVRAINPAALKDVASITSAIMTVDHGYKELRDIVATLDSRQTSIRSDINTIAASAGRIDDVAKEDFRKILALARAPRSQYHGACRSAPGPAADRECEEIPIVRGYCPCEDRGVPTRAGDRNTAADEGAGYPFPGGDVIPKYWVRNLVVSGGTDRTQDTEYLYAKGEVKNIASDQRVTGLPMTVQLSGTQAGKVSATFGALMDRRKQTPVDEYKAGITGIGISDIGIGSESFLKGKITGSQLAAEVTVSIPGDRFDGSANLHFRQVGFSYAGAPAHIGERLVRDVLDGVNGFDLKLRGWKTDAGFDVALATDLDALFIGRVKAVLGAELTKAQAELRARSNAIIAKKRQEFETVYNARKAEVEQQLAQYQALVNEKISMVETKKKELEERLEKEKKGRIDDAVKKIFKKK